MRCHRLARLLWPAALFTGLFVFVLPPLKLQAQDELQPKTPPPKSLGSVSGFPDWVTGLAWSPQGDLVAAGSYDEVRLIDAKTKKSTGRLKIRGLGQSLAFSPDGKTLAVGAFRSLTLWDVKTRKPTRELKGHRGYVTGLVFSKDGKLLISSAEDATVRIWNAGDGTEVKSITDFEYPVMGVALSPDGNLLATASGDETRVTQPGPVRLWELPLGKERNVKLVAHEKVAKSVAFSPDGKFLISTGVDEKVNVYDVAAGKALGYFAKHQRPVNAAAFANSADVVVSVAGGRAKGGYLAMLWNRADGEVITQVEAHKGKITSLALSPDARQLATGSYDGTVAFWDVSPFTKAKQTEAPVAKPWHLAEKEQIRAGIIGLDTSHVKAFTNLLNAKDAGDEFRGVKIVAAYPQGSPDIQSSVRRVPEYTAAVKKQGVEIVDSIPALIEKVDVVFLETNDGRPHLEQILPVLKAGKPVFVDKPIAGSLTDALAIFQAAKHYDVPVFSSSSLRYATGAQAVRGGSIGDVKSATAFSPCVIEPTHPDLYWYGIHGVELLFTAMGTGCQSVKRTVSTATQDVVVGQWTGERTGTFEGYRAGKPGYGGTAAGSEGKAELGPYRGYKPLLLDIVSFFRTGKSPVPQQETIEIYAFMEAADESKRNDGAEIQLADLIAKAEAAAKQKLKDQFGIATGKPSAAETTSESKSNPEP